MPEVTSKLVSSAGWAASVFDERCRRRLGIMPPTEFDGICTRLRYESGEPFVWAASGWPKSSQADLLLVRREFTEAEQLLATFSFSPLR